MTNPVFLDNTVAADGADNLQAAVAAVEAPPEMLPEWTPQRVAMATLTALGVAFIFYLLYQFYMVVFIFFVAITLQIALRPVVDWLQRRGVRPEISLALIYLLLLGSIGGLLWLAAPLLIEQATAIWQQIPEYYHAVRNTLFSSSNRLLRALAVTLPLQPTFLNLTPATTESSSLGAVAPIWQTVRTAGYFFFLTLAILLLSFYWMLEGELIKRRAVLVAPMNRRDELRELLTEVEIKVGAYFRGQLILCVIIGVASIAIYFLIGLPYALGLGLIMGFFEFIPIIGPTLGAVPALLVALTMAPDTLVWVLVAVLAIQMLENNLLVPRIMDQSVGVNAILSLLGISAFGLLFGIGGAILAIPLAAILQILLSRILFNAPISEEAPPSPAVIANALDRNQASVLRFATQDLVQDVRKQVRATKDEVADPDAERAEDLLEAIALDLDGLLSKVEDARL
ncbi:MAG: AI-2E family transporter [Chloroflexota bacterium]|nr:AI-2E family transporter [Chloroflexota bacterium]